MGILVRIVQVIGMTAKDLSTLVNGMQKIETGVMSTEIVAKMMVKLRIRRVAFVVADLMADLMMDLMMAITVTMMSQIHHHQHLLLFQIFNQNRQIVWIDQAGMILMELSIIVNGMQIMINVENGETVAEMRVSLLMRYVFNIFCFT